MDAENSDPTVDFEHQQDEPPTRRPWPWLVGGLALGVIIGVVAAPYLWAARDFFRAPGWGWTAAKTFADRGILLRR